MEIVKIDSISQLREVIGLGKPEHPLITLIKYDDIVFEETKHLNKKFIINTYSISLKSVSGGKVKFGRSAYDFEDGVLVFKTPEQVAHFEPDEDCARFSGWSLHFHPDLIRKSELGKHIDKYSFFAYKQTEALHLSEREKGVLLNIMQTIKEEYALNIDKHSQKLIITNIELLLDYCARFYDRQFYTRSNMNKDIVIQFEGILREYINSDQLNDLGIPTVKYCADQLNMTPNYLGDLLKKETGQSAQEHIHHYIIEKAKNQLLASSEQVSQIAYSLGFESAPYFSKLFKRKTGYSPGEYRELNR
ncbi:helix-turn-helix domain-containing protein [Aureibacter tunicatorum]|uniref:AraC-like DNA-binding protein n=1 Tax=Aureibacter tunicatorum TaxID=866807 RepID=A0AAE4BU77_9BACT|nr:helix-turn-helix transcriptional regulator [Aureibacter tunicatorum]MDR6241511.1 AraC-like DNA-binding protein [Aureibacter tunicatorum]BDD07031.1 AraC family transcriptional regulator [Aureibacter tunicatorum]